MNAFLWTLIIQRIFSLPTDSLLLVFLQYSRYLCEFCGFDKVPDASKITRFNQDFLENLQAVFNHLVNLTEPICQSIDSAKAAMTIFDFSGIKTWVTENNPKYANRIIKQPKAYAKAMHFGENYDPYKAAYSPMPPQIPILNSFTLTGIFVMPTNLALLHFLSNPNLCHYSPCFSILFNPRYSKTPSFSTIGTHIPNLFRNYLVMSLKS